MDAQEQVAVQLKRASELFAPFSLHDFESVPHRRDHYRPSLPLPGLAQFTSLCPDALTLIDPPTSDEESDSDRCGPNVRMVTEAILDSQMTKISVAGKQDDFVPCEYQHPALIFFHLDGNMASGDLMRVFGKRYAVVKVQMVDFAGDSGFSHCGIVYFKHPDEGTLQTAQKLYVRLKVEEANGTLGSRVHHIPGAQRMVNVKWIRNETLNDQSDWSAVVLRNLPPNYTVEAIMNLLNPKTERPVLRIEPPRTVKGKYCTIAVTRNIEDAEKICKRLNNTRIGGECVKVHMHPGSKGKRREDSHHKLFNTTSVNGKKLKPQSLLLEKLLNIFPSENGKTTGPTFEDGEIPDVNHQAYVPPAPVSKFYTLYEFPGVTYFQKSARSHQGMQIMTTHTNDDVGSPNNE